MNPASNSHSDSQSEVNHFSSAQQITFEEWIKTLALKDDSDLSCWGNIKSLIPQNKSYFFRLGNIWGKDDSQEMADAKSSRKLPD